jgi:hypothetical protein
MASPRPPTIGRGKIVACRECALAAAWPFELKEAKIKLCARAHAIVERWTTGWRVKLMLSGLCCESRSTTTQN